MHRIPDCFGSGAPIFDDCMVSCAYVEECVSQHQEREEEAERARMMRPIWDRCDACNHKEQCGGCMVQEIYEACKTCPALSVPSDTLRKDEK